MSTLYPDLDFTKYPGSLDNIELKSNITNSTDAQLVNQIQTAIIAGDFATAANILNSNPHLNGKIFNANDYNQMRDALLALERFYKNDIYNYISEKQSTWESNIDRFNFKGIYSPTTQYYQNNMVNYTTAEGNLLYLCIKQPPTGTAPTDTNYWRVFTIRGERGETGDGLSFTWVWSNLSQYKKDDVVIFNSKWWIAKQPSQNQIPVEGSTYWEVMLTALPATQIPVTSSQPTNQVIGDQWYQVV